MPHDDEISKVTDVRDVQEHRDAVMEAIREEQAQHKLRRLEEMIEKRENA